VTPRARRAGLGLAATLLACGLLTGAQAQPSREQVRAAEQARREELATQREAAQRAAAAKAEALKLTAQQERILARLREAEGATSSVATRIEALEQRRRDAAQRLAARIADFTPLLPVLERLALFPSETMLAAPLPPEQSVRGALVLGGIVRTLEREARALKVEQAEVAALQAQLDAELPRMAAAQAAQAKAAEVLDEQIRATHAEGRAAEDEATRAARRAAAEAERAGELRSAIAKIESERRAAEAQARREAQEAGRRRQVAAAEAARERQASLAAPAGPGLSEDGPASGARPGGAPVSGTLVRGFGEATDSGPSTGLAYHAAPGARVVSPCAGRIVFAGPFRSFGQLVIVDCGGGYHFVLAGFDRIDLGVGQRVASGQPVGVMPGWDPRTGGGRPSLYVELRRSGQAVNPAPFLRGRS
jgi:septal ring factor EnvC (AmiA/AmiB activator)